MNENPLGVMKVLIMKFKSGQTFDWVKSKIANLLDKDYEDLVIDSFRNSI